MRTALIVLIASVIFVGCADFFGLNEEELSPPGWIQGIWSLEADPSDRMWTFTDSWAEYSYPGSAAFYDGSNASDSSGPGPEAYSISSGSTRFQFFLGSVTYHSTGTTEPLLQVWRYVDGVLEDTKDYVRPDSEYFNP